MTCEEAVVTVTAFGQGRYRSKWSGASMTVAQVMHEHDIVPNGRRVAVNGHPADGTTAVTEGDELTIVPRVQGG